MNRISGLSAAKHLFSLPRPRHVGMAFFWACSMLTFKTSNMIPADVDPIMFSTALQFFASACTIATIVAIALMEWRKAGFVDRLPSWLFTSITIAGIGVLTASAQYSTTDSIYLDTFLLGCLLIGVGYGYFWAVWYQAYGKMHQDLSSTTLPIAFVVTMSLFLFIPWLAQTIKLPTWSLILPLPALSAGFLYRCRKLDQSDKQAIDNERGLTPSIKALREVISAAIIFSFLFGFVWEASVMVLGSVNEAHRTPSFISLIAAIALVLVTTFGRRRWDITMLYEYGTPVIVIAFALFPVMFSTNITLVDSIMDGGYSILEILAWVLVADVSYDYRVSGAITGAITRVSFLLFMTIGVIAAFLTYLLASNMALSPAIFSILAIAAIWVWLMMAHKDSQIYAPGSAHHDREFADYTTDNYHGDPEQVKTIGQAFEDWTSSMRRAALPQANVSAAFSGIANASAIYVDGVPTDVDSAVAVTAAPTNEVANATDNADVALDSDSKTAPEAKPTRNASDSNAKDTNTRARKNGAIETAMNESQAFGIEDLCLAVSKHYGLSRRESELLPLLTMGRSASFIADTFFISENTVRTHIKHIVEKTGAESKRAITDFVYEKGRELIEEGREEIATKQHAVK